MMPDVFLVFLTYLPTYPNQILHTVIPIVKKCPKNQILSENISLASIYSSQAIDVHFCVKNSYFLIFIKLAIFVLVYLMNYKKIYHLRTNTTCSGQFCSNSWFCISGSLFWIRKTWSYVHQFSPVKITIFFWNCSLKRIVKSGVETQFCQSSRQIISQ